MKDESDGSVDSLVRSVFQSVRAQLASFSTGAHLAWAEMRVVAGHAGLFIGLVIVTAGLVLAGWGLILVMGVLVLMSIGFTVVLSVLAMIILNLFALVAVYLCMRHTLKIISFKHTRKALGIEATE